MLQKMVQGNQVQQASQKSSSVWARTWLHLCLFQGLFGGLHSTHYQAHSQRNMQGTYRQHRWSSGTNSICSMCRPSGKQGRRGRSGRSRQLPWSRWRKSNDQDKGGRQKLDLKQNARHFEDGIDDWKKQAERSGIAGIRPRRS